MVSSWFFIVFVYFPAPIITAVAFVSFACFVGCDAASSVRLAFAIMASGPQQSSGISGSVLSESMSSSSEYDFQPVDASALPSLPSFAHKDSCHSLGEGLRVVGGTSLVHLDPSLNGVNGVNGVNGANGVKGVDGILERPTRDGPAVLGGNSRLNRSVKDASFDVRILPASSALSL